MEIIMGNYTLHPSRRARLLGHHLRILDSMEWGSERLTIILYRIMSFNIEVGGFIRGIVCHRSPPEVVGSRSLSAIHDTAGP